MNKRDLVKKLANEAGIKQNEVEEVLKAFVPIVIEECVNNDGEVVIPGLGKFQQSYFASRVGRNPATGEDMTFNASKTVKFKTSSSVKVVIEEKPAKKASKPAAKAPAKKATGKKK